MFPQSLDKKFTASYCFALSRLCSDCHAHTASSERERERGPEREIERERQRCTASPWTICSHCQSNSWYVTYDMIRIVYICYWWIHLPSGWFARSPFGACTTRCNTVSSQAVIFICWESVLDSWSRFILTEDKSSRTCSPNILEHYPQRPNVSDSQSVDKVADSQRRRRAERSLCWSELGGRYSDKMWQDQAMSGNVVWCFLSQ